MGAFLYGRHTATVEAERDALAERDAMYRSIEELAITITQRDAALLAEQNKAEIVRIEKVKEYVIRYRDKIVEVPAIAECVDNSGLLELINSTMPTAKAVE